MLELQLDTLSKYIVQNNPIEVKNNLMRMRLVGDDFDMTHDNFKSLLASLKQDPQYLTDVTANALDVLVDNQRAGMNYLRALQSTTGYGLGDLSRMVASHTFNAAQQMVSQSAAATQATGEITERKFSAALVKKNNPDSEDTKLTPLGWALVILILLALCGGLWVMFSGIYSKIKKSNS